MIYNQDLLERRMERMKQIKQMSRRQFVNSGGFVHYQNCRLLEYINQNYWNGRGTEKGKGKGTTTETTIPWHQHCATTRGKQYTLPKLQIIRVYYPKLLGTIYNQDLLERRMERMKQIKQMSRRQFVNSGGFVHYQNCSLLEYIIQNYLERYISGLIGTANGANKTNE